MTTDVEPINLKTIRGWARRTAVVDRATYRSKTRPVTPRRLWRMVAPNLRQPIFLVGAPRSGTTFVGASLSVLPQLSYHFEPVVIRAAARYVYDQQWSFRKARRFYRRVYSWLMRLHLDGDLILAEKTPRNSLVMGFLYQAFPDARFIHIIRDGRDAALSLAKQSWFQSAQAHTGNRGADGYLQGPRARFWIEPDRVTEYETTSDIHRCAWNWRVFTESVLQASVPLPPSQYLVIRYEDLVQSPHIHAERLSMFLGVTDSDSLACLKAAFHQARTDSVGRWQHELDESALRQIESEAGPLLAKLGYGHEEAVQE